MYSGDPGGLICSAGGRDIAFPVLYRVVQSLSAAELRALGKGRGKPAARSGRALGLLVSRRCARSPGDPSPRSHREAILARFHDRNPARSGGQGGRLKNLQRCAPVP